ERNVRVISTGGRYWRWSNRLRLARRWGLLRTLRLAHREQDNGGSDDNYEQYRSEAYEKFCVRPRRSRVRGDRRRIRRRLGGLERRFCRFDTSVTNCRRLIRS